MKLSLNLLKDYIDLNINAADIEKIKEYCDKMTNSGSKVEGYEILAEEIKNVVIGRIESTEKHPDADKLTICQINVGKEENIQIVTGAKNIKAGDIIPVALHKSTLPDGKKIEKGKLRGVESNGMLCSISELGVTLHDFPYAEADGILVIEDDVKIGEDVKTALKLQDTVVEFEITPNRPDCLSVIGLARESAATYGKKYEDKKPQVKNADKTDSVSNYLSVEVKNPTLCPRYSARVVKNVKIAPSPLWLRAYLRASGIRPINNIVDITNFVMLEYGQPMHAFDYNYIDYNYDGEKKIIVRTAEKDEEITTLDSVAHTLTEEMLVIADTEKAIALAGVMGGENSEIKEATTIVVFESANFNKKSVRMTAKKLGMRTDSSSRYEKGLDCEMTSSALDRACELCEILGAGTVVDGVIDVYPVKKENLKIKIEYEKINALLGTDISESEIDDILMLLDFEVKDGYATVPSYRSDDVSMTADLAEEVARIYGYNKIGESEITRRNPSDAIVRGGLSRHQKFMRRIHNTLTGVGACEIYTYSFISPKLINALGLPEDANLAKQVRIINPLGEDTSVMRTALLPNMLETLSRNNARKSENACLYELAKVYNRKISDGLPEKGSFAAEEKYTLNIGLYDNSHSSENFPVLKGIVKTVFSELGTNFYILKGIVEALLSELGIKQTTLEYSTDISVNPLSPAYHPGRSAVLISNGAVLGILGEIHPITAGNFDLKRRIYSAEIDVDALYSLYNEERKYTPLPRYPSMVRDLALVCDKDTESAAIQKIIKNSGGELIKDIVLFDAYMGDKIEKGKKSLAYSITLSHPDRTLTDEETNSVTEKILAALNSEGITLRG